jgi:SpoVK/Ycf46/Vps4 family AAA+-type ATPase
VAPWPTSGGSTERELLLWPLLYSREETILGLIWPKGLLLYGPPGTRNTTLIYAIVRECDSHLTLISAGLVRRAYAGESERILWEAFAVAGRPTIIFIDEIDALCPRRDSKWEQESRIFSQLLTLMDGTKSSSISPERVGVVVS